MITAGWPVGTQVTIDHALTNGIEIQTTVLSSKMVRQPNGTTPRFYSVQLPVAHLDKLHEQFAAMASAGISEKALKLYVQTPTTTVEVPITTQPAVDLTVQTVTSPTPVIANCNSVTHKHSLNACIDNACTFNIINTEKYFIPGTTRESHMQASFNSPGASVMCTTSGLVQLRQEDGGIHMDRWHYIPGAHRSLLSLLRLTPQGFSYTGLNEHTLISKNGVQVFTCLPEREVPNYQLTKAELDDDNYVPPLIQLDEACFILPDNVRIPECNLVAPPPRSAIKYHHEVHATNNRFVNRKVQHQNLGTNIVN